MTNADLVPLSQPLPGASFGQAVSRFFKKYATFSGRASRSEFWWVQLFLIVVQVILGTIIGISIGTSIDPATGVASVGPFAIILIVIAAIFTLAVLIPSIAITVRRLHDANYTGWLYLLNLTSIGAVVVLIFTILKSNPQGARFDV